MRNCLIPQPLMPDASARFDLKVTWLKQCFCLNSATNKVVDLYATDPPFEWTFDGFKNTFAHMWEHRIANGKMLKIRATSDWLDSEPMTVKGIIMRPDRNFPLFDNEAGLTFKNNFAPFAWDRVSILRVKPFLRYIRRLIPDIDECEYFIDCIAHKLLHPDVPGPSIVMVAVDENDQPLHGTGRGTLTKVLQGLFGFRYVKTIPFETFAGLNSQTQFSASWQANSLIVCVDEAKAVDANSFTGRRGIYENIKGLVDPSKTIRTLTDKRIPYFDTFVFSSYIVYSNHVDALQLPTDDERRFYVLRNGRKPTPAESYEINAWVADEDNIAALDQWMRLRDLSAFNPYEVPPQTKAKSEMQRASKTDMEIAFEQAERYMPGIAMHSGQLHTWVASFCDDPLMMRGPAFAAVKRARTKAVMQAPDFKNRRQVRMKGRLEPPKHVIAFAGKCRAAEALDTIDLKAQVRLNDATPSAHPRLTSILGGLHPSAAQQPPETLEDDEM